MQFLRNRFETTNPKNNFKTQNTLFKPSPLSIVPHEFQQSMDNFIAQLPNDISFEEKTAQIKYMADIFNQYGELINDCSQNPERLDLLLDDLNTALSTENPDKLNQFITVLNAKAKPAKVSTQSWSSPFTKSDLFNAVSAYSPIAGTSLLLLSIVAPAAAQSLTEHKGFPNGGRDLCAGLGSCLQGYFKQNDKLASQFNHIIDQRFGSDGGALWQLRQCFDISKVANAVKDTLALPSLSNITADCTATPSKFMNYPISAKATNIATNACTTFQSNINSAAQSCMNTGNAIGYNFAIAGIAIGVILACAGVAVAVCCITKHTVNQSCC